MSRYADIDKAMELAAKTMVNGTQVAYVVMGLANFVENVLNNAEVEADPIKHGRWESKTKVTKLPGGAGGTVTAYFCSICKKPIQGKGTQFCPNCGAKMDEVEE